jgi:hypothetical protein
MLDIFKEVNEKFETFGELFISRVGQKKYEFEFHAFTVSSLSSSIEIFFSLLLHE